MPKKDTNGIIDKLLRRRLIALTALVAALMVPVVLYLGYDLLKSYVSPCSSIFEQTAVSLETKIKFLKTEGEIVLGKEQLTELSERAQMTAINLQGCCQVLDSGKLNPEQFLQCKQSARQYDGDLKNVVALVEQTLSTEAGKLSNKIDEVRHLVAAAVEEARNTSRDFNERIVEVRQDQAVSQLKVIAPAEFKVEAKEKEPNNDPLHTNAIELDKWITGAIGGDADADYYTFVTPETHRDLIRVELKNRSTTLRPRFDLYYADKAKLGAVEAETSGADLSYQIVGGPNAKYYLRIGAWGRRSQGLYLVRVKPLEAYDAFEPNNNILQAKSISLGSPIEAGIMDGRDVDYYRVTTGATGGTLLASLENRSTTLRPALRRYNASKENLGGVNTETYGANLRHQAAAAPNTEYFIRVGNFNRGSSGEYTLTVKLQ